MKNTEALVGQDLRKNYLNDKIIWSVENDEF